MSVAFQLSRIHWEGALMLCDDVAATREMFMFDYYCYRSNGTVYLSDCATRLALQLLLYSISGPDRFDFFVALHAQATISRIIG